jgi:hypothetical protein
MRIWCVKTDIVLVLHIQRSVHAHSLTYVYYRTSEIHYGFPPFRWKAVLILLFFIIFFPPKKIYAIIRIVKHYRSLYSKYWEVIKMNPTHLIDWLIIYSFMSCSRIFNLYGDITIAGEGLQNLGLSLALRAFEQGGIFIMSHLLWHGTSVFPVSSEGPPHLVTFYDTRGDVEDLF